MIFIPDLLKKTEFLLTRFLLEIQEEFTVTSEVILRLRRELNLVERHSLGMGSSSVTSLLHPSFPVDPIALRRHQKPSPPFVILPPDDLPSSLVMGDVFVLTVFFFGDGARSIGDFINVIRLLGDNGIYNGTGRFELVSVVADDPSGNSVDLWQPGEDTDDLPYPLIDLAWWIGTPSESPASLRIRFLTPARLLTHGKPLFRPNFRSIFPFLLRRITTMLYFYCGVEIVEDHRAVLEQAFLVHEFDNRLFWEDWKRLEADHGGVDLGGVTGTVSLMGDVLSQIEWLLKVGTLMNLGKGAAYGAGHYILEDI